MILKRFATCVASLVPLLLPCAGWATSAEVNTATQSSTGFTDGTTTPFTICVYENPNGGAIGQWGGLIGTSNSLQLHWDQSAYDGTRLKRGVEFCGGPQIYKEGWWGFKFFLPSPGYPTDKSAGIAQLFQSGNCNSWAALINVINGSLQLSYRHNCSTPTDVTLVSAIQYNSWNAFVIHFVASHLGAGSIQVWYNGVSVYNATNINFGFGTWNADDTLATGNALGFAGGEYNWDPGNYTTGETRTMYFDNVCELLGNPTDAYTTASP